MLLIIKKPNVWILCLAYYSFNLFSTSTSTTLSSLTALTAFKCAVLNQNANSLQWLENDKQQNTISDGYQP